MSKPIRSIQLCDSRDHDVVIYDFVGRADDQTQWKERGTDESAIRLPELMARLEKILSRQGRKHGC